MKLNIHSVGMELKNFTNGEVSFGHHDAKVDVKKIPETYPHVTHA